MKINISLTGSYDDDKTPVEVLWTAKIDRGDYVSLLQPDLDYTGLLIAEHAEPLTEGQPIDTSDCIMLPRKEVGGLGMALLTNFVDHSNGYIDYASKRIEQIDE